MKYLHHLFIGFLLFATSCEQVLISEHSFDEEVNFKLNNSVHISDDSDALKIKFTEVLENSLCPPTADCVWQGRARILIKLDDEKVIELGITENDNTKKVVYKDFEIQMIALIPEYDGNENSVTVNFNLTLIIHKN